MLDVPPSISLQTTASYYVLLNVCVVDDHLPATLLCTLEYMYSMDGRHHYIYYNITHIMKIWYHTLYKP
jgi:hypothetical protein